MISKRLYFTQACIRKSGPCRGSSATEYLAVQVPGFTPLSELLALQAGSRLVGPGDGESFDFAQDREPVERLVDPFGIWYLKFFNC